MVGVSLKDLWKSSNINDLQVASKAFIRINLKMQGKPFKIHFGRFPLLKNFKVLLGSCFILTFFYK